MLGQRIEGVGGWEAGGVGREVATAVKKTVQRNSTVKTRTPEQSI